MALPAGEADVLVKAVCSAEPTTAGCCAKPSGCSPGRPKGRVSGSATRYPAIKKPKKKPPTTAKALTGPARPPRPSTSVDGQPGMAERLKPQATRAGTGSLGCRTNLFAQPGPALNGTRRLRLQPRWFRSAGWARSQLLVGPVRLLGPGLVFRWEAPAPGGCRSGSARGGIDLAELLNHSLAHIRQPFGLGLKQHALTGGLLPG